MGVPKFYRWLSCAAPLAARHSPFPAHPSPPPCLLLRTSQRALPSDQPARLRGQYVAPLCRERVRYDLGASAAQSAEWPRLAEAPGSLEHELALIEASREPAGRVFLRLRVSTYGRPAVDNFYLDANGILHKCTHGDAGESVAASIDDSLVLICRCPGSRAPVARSLPASAPLHPRSATRRPSPAPSLHPPPSPRPSAATSTTWCSA